MATLTESIIQGTFALIFDSPARYTSSMQFSPEDNIENCDSGKGTQDFDDNNQAVVNEHAMNSLKQAMHLRQVYGLDLIHFFETPMDGADMETPILNKWPPLGEARSDLENHDCSIYNQSNASGMNLRNNQSNDSKLNMIYNQYTDSRNNFIHNRSNDSKKNLSNNQSNDSRKNSISDQSKNSRLNMIYKQSKDLRKKNNAHKANNSRFNLIYNQYTDSRTNFIYNHQNDSRFNLICNQSKESMKNLKIYYPGYKRNTSDSSSTTRNPYSETASPISLPEVDNVRGFRNNAKYYDSPHSFGSTQDDLPLVKMWNERLNEWNVSGSEERLNDFDGLTIDMQNDESTPTVITQNGFNNPLISECFRRDGADTSTVCSQEFSNQLSWPSWNGPPLSSDNGNLKVGFPSDANNTFADNSWSSIPNSYPSYPFDSPSTDGYFPNWDTDAPDTYSPLCFAYERQKLKGYELPSRSKKLTGVYVGNRKFSETGNSVQQEHESRIERSDNQNVFQAVNQCETQNGQEANKSTRRSVQNVDLSPADSKCQPDAIAADHKLSDIGCYNEPDLNDGSESSTHLTALKILDVLRRSDSNPGVELPNAYKTELLSQLTQCFVNLSSPERNSTQGNPTVPHSKPTTEEMEAYPLSEINSLNDTSNSICLNNETVVAGEIYSPQQAAVDSHQMVNSHLNKDSCPDVYPMFSNDCSSMLQSLVQSNIGAAMNAANYDESNSNGTPPYLWKSDQKDQRSSQISSRQCLSKKNKYLVSQWFHAQPVFSRELESECFPDAPNSSGHGSHKMMSFRDRPHCPSYTPSGSTNLPQNDSKGPSFSAFVRKRKTMAVDESSGKQMFLKEVPRDIGRGIDWFNRTAEMNHFRSNERDSSQNPFAFTQKDEQAINLDPANHREIGVNNDYENIGLLRHAVLKTANSSNNKSRFYNSENSSPRADCNPQFFAPRTSLSMTPVSGNSPSFPDSFQRPSRQIRSMNNNRLSASSMKALESIFPGLKTQTMNACGYNDKSMAAGNVVQQFVQKKIYSDDRDRMVYVSWIPKKGRAFNADDKRSMELDLKQKLRCMGLTGLTKVLLFPPKGVHCKLIFDSRQSAASFMKKYGGENASFETESWKCDICKLYDIDMHEKFDKTVVKIEWSQK